MGGLGGGGRGGGKGSRFRIRGTIDSHIHTDSHTHIRAHIRTHARAYMHTCTRPETSKMRFKGSLRISHRSYAKRRVQQIYFSAFLEFPSIAQKSTAGEVLTSQNSALASDTTRHQPGNHPRNRVQKPHKRRSRDYVRGCTSNQPDGYPMR